jgi:hypothetical protein
VLDVIPLGSVSGARLSAAMGDREDSTFILGNPADDWLVAGLCHQTESLDLPVGDSYSARKDVRRGPTPLVIGVLPEHSSAVLVPWPAHLSSIFPMLWQKRAENEADAGAA